MHVRAWAGWRKKDSFGVVRRQVCQKVEEKITTTYSEVRANGEVFRFVVNVDPAILTYSVNQVADELVLEFDKDEIMQLDEKNIRY
jgi:hypothetical protein